MFRSLLVVSLVVLGLAGCSQSSSQKVKVYLTDAPLDGATAVNITVSGVRAIGSGEDEGEDKDGTVLDGETEGASKGASKGASNEEAPKEADKSTVTFEEPRVFNLLELRNGIRMLLGEVEVEGDLAQLRLLMDGSATVVYEDGTERVAKVPSGAQSGVKIVGIPAGAEEITLDFDAAKSIHETGNGQLIMKPTIKALAGEEVVGETEEAAPATGEQVE